MRQATFVFIKEALGPCGHWGSPHTRVTPPGDQGSLGCRGSHRGALAGLGQPSWCSPTRGPGRGTPTGASSAPHWRWAKDPLGPLVTVMLCLDPSACPVYFSLYFLPSLDKHVPRVSWVSDPILGMNTW